MRTACQSKDDDQRYQKNQKGCVGGRSLRFAQEEIMNYCGETTFIQRETAKTGLDMIQYRQEVSVVALACARNKFADKRKEEKNC